MKKLTHAVFDLPECPDWAESAAVHRNGEASWFDVPKQYIDEDSGCWGYTRYFQPSELYRHKLIGIGFDATNWQQSAIDRGEK